MGDSRQDRDFSFGYMESENKEKAPNKEKAQKSSKRFHRSVYGKESGKYLASMSDSMLVISYHILLIYSRISIEANSLWLYNNH